MKSLVSMRKSSKFSILFLIDRPQDYHVLIPIVEYYKKTDQTKIVIYISLSEAIKSFSIFKKLKGIRKIIVPDIYLQKKVPKSDKYDVVISAADSSLGAHKNTFLFIRNYKHIHPNALTLNVQHGIDFLEVDGHELDYIEHASDYVAVWLDQSETGRYNTIQRGLKSIPTGKIYNDKVIKRKKNKEKNIKKAIVVCENIHYYKYSSEYRCRYVSMIEYISKKFGDHTIYVQPHPGGKWSRKNIRSKNNIVVSRGGLSILELITDLEKDFEVEFVITTPSSVLVDCAYFDLEFILIDAEFETRPVGKLKKVKIQELMKMDERSIREKLNKLDFEKFSLPPESSMERLNQFILQKVESRL